MQQFLSLERALVGASPNKRKNDTESVQKVPIAQKSDAYRPRFCRQHSTNGISASAEEIDWHKNHPNIKCCHEKKKDCHWNNTPTVST